MWIEPRPHGPGSLQLVPLVMDLECQEDICAPGEE